MVAVAVSALACSSEPRGEEGASVGSAATAATEAEDATSPGDGSSGGSSDPDGSSGADEDGTKLDVGPPGNTSNGDESDECTNVDILFVIDNSGSMADNQDQLIASFPGFVAGMQDALEFAESYHIGVVTSSNYPENGDCWEYGHLITQTTGAPLSSDAVCGPFSSGSTYIDETEPDLAGKFECIAKVGGGGADDEMPVRSLLDALKPGNNAPGACNDGFSRLDSLLVIVIISDEDDVNEECGPDEFPCFPTGTEGTPDEWHSEVLTYKANLAENVVVVSIIGTELDNPCGATPASHLMSFTNNFAPNGHIGDICAATYDAVFTAALPVIDEACENYVEPEG